MNESRSSRRGILVGLFICLGVAFLISGILIIGNLRETFKQKMKLSAVFEDVNGLQAGNNVWFSGVKIGTVNNLEFRGKSQVHVIFKIETKAQAYIRKDAKVKIGSEGLIGNKTLVIYGGTSSANEVEEGDILGVEKTFSSEDMLSTLQDNNNNLKSITNDFKTISRKLANGEGTIGKFLNDTSIYAHMNAVAASLQKASEKSEQLITSLSSFSAGLNKKGALANQLVTDTVLFNSIKASALQLQKISDTTSAFMSDLQKASINPKSSIGVLLHDEQSAAALKATIGNLQNSSENLNKDLEGLQHSFLLRRYFKKSSKK
jgi:phospholipid/cholesterol/gamma-HCH transport system substrate-binding protein